MSERNFKIVVEYDGTDYHGWQRQKILSTVQGEIEKRLKIMTRQDIVLNGSGRTDAGVHAVGQVANFRCVTGLGQSEFFNGLNSLLPDDIVIRDCTEVEENFHARFNAKHKTYRYRIINTEIRPAIGRHYAWFIRKPLDIDAMNKAIGHITGTHDFKAFESTGSPRSHTVRTVFDARFFENTYDGHLVFEIKADGFLKYMVRNIVGTLVNVGLGRTKADDIKRILQSRDRGNAGKTAPSHGLFLVCVEYEHCS